MFSIFSWPTDSKFCHEICLHAQVKRRYSQVDLKRKMILIFFRVDPLMNIQGKLEVCRDAKKDSWTDGYLICFLKKTLNIFTAS